MKNIIVKLFSILIISIFAIIPFFSIAVNNNNNIEKILPPIISEELGTLSEITPVVDTIEITEEKYKIYYTFEEKISKLSTSGNLDLLTTTEPVTEVIVIEEIKPTCTYSATSPTQSSKTETYTTTTKSNVGSTSAKIEPTTYSQIEEIKKEEYEVAETVWNFLRELGFNKAVCAGILGNMMSECGGHTLDLQWWIGSSGYYGLCQWHLGYCPEVTNANLYEQLTYLKNTIKKEFNNFGYKFYHGFNYEAFCRLDNYYDAAIAFAQCYERCASWTYKSRINNAYKAYNYFA